MKEEQFRAKQQAMSDQDLIEKAETMITELARTYGKSHTMSIPPMITDTDMLLSELVRRYKRIVFVTDTIVKLNSLGIKYVVLSSPFGIAFDLSDVPDGVKLDDIVVNTLSDRSNKIQLLDSYTKYLQKNGYLDTDATSEPPFAIDEFLKTQK